MSGTTVPDMYGYKHIPTQFDRNQGLKDRRLSVCPLCNAGIYGTDETTFIRTPVTGTVHRYCAERVGS